MEEGVRGRGAGADSCFPCTRSPLLRCRRGVGLPGGPLSPVLLPFHPYYPVAAAARRRGSVLRWAYGGRPGSATRRRVPSAAPQPAGSASPGTMPQLGGGWPGTPRFVPAAAVLLGALCLPGALASSLLTGTGARGGGKGPLARGLCGAHLPPGPAVERGGCPAFRGRAEGWRCNCVVWGR